jgi:single-strand DNA-binding protein
VNSVALTGTVATEPRLRDLPSGAKIWNVELSTPIPGGSTSVPCVVDGDIFPAGVRVGDTLTATGYVSRRFFRAGGVTQSRTEIVVTRCSRGEDY